ncbi:MAG: NTP transferase domain-containing protein [Gemmatimonadetes bacterium]|nr:NTP transferase domain-containing protein [Gemmatimonadota bacterium]
MQAIIPLAGKGTRVRPHTHSRPKPLLRVGNRPVLSYVVDQLVESGVTELICITGHLADQIESYLAREYPGLEKRYVEQVEQRGTADAIRLARPLVRGPVLIVFVDTIFDADLSLIESRPEDDGIIWAKEVEDYQRFGVIVTDDDGYMSRIVEKPAEPISRLANIGLYYIRDHELMFEGIAEVMAREPLLGEYFLTDAFQYMIDQGSRIFTAEVEGWWDCGKVETLLETNREMLRRGAVALAEDVRLEDAEIGPNVSIARGSVVRRSRLRDCIVGAETRIEDCDLWDSIVGDHARVMGIRGTVNLGDHSEVVAGAAE